MMTPIANILFRSFVCVILFNACVSPPDNEHPAKDSGAAAKDPESATSVETAIVENRTFNYLIQTNGKIKPLYEQVITAESSGKILFCKARPGELFSKGTLILQLETASAELRIERARLGQYNTQKEYESQLLGYQDLLKGRDSLQDSAIRKKLHISSGLSGAEQDMKEAQYELSKSLIRAPFYCRIADVKVQQGGFVKAGQDMFRLYDPVNLFLEVKILETDIALLSTNTAATIVPVSNPKKRYTAFVYDINPYIDENGMALVRLKLTAGSPLFPGMNCTAIISIPAEKSLVVPKEAVVMRNGKPVVFTVEKGIARWNYVTVGKDNGKEVEIKEGIKNGDKVITSNNLQLAHDAPVKQVAASMVTDSSKNE